MRRFFVFIVTAALTFGLAKPAQAQSTVEVTEAQVSYTFGEQITFTARIQSASPIQAAFLFFQVEGEPNTRINPLVINADGTSEFRHFIQNGAVRPFAMVAFWYLVTLTSGENFTSPQFFFKYEDNRHAWQTLEDQGVRVHWYAGEAAFGQAALYAAQAGLQAAQNLLAMTTTEPIDIYIYPSAADVQDTLELGGLPWIDGLASPELGVALVPVAPGAEQGIEMDRQIPHELAHILLHRLTGANYANLPAWLREGLASLAEQYPNADYAHALDSASQRHSLIPMADLCGSFPQDTAGALLAYAESASFTRHLQETYGNPGLQALIQAYADGLTCEQGAQRALGLSLARLEADWRHAVLGENVAWVAFQNLLPYLVVLAFILAIPVWTLWVSIKRRA